MVLRLLRFTFTVDILSPIWKDDKEKETFMVNCEDVLQRGLNMMTVPDWIVTVRDVEEIKEEELES